VAFSGDICLVVEDTDADTIARLRARGVIVERSAQASPPRMTAMSSRFFNYLDILIQRGNDYTGVMLVDPTVDVLDTNPFTAPLPADILYTPVPRRIGEDQTVRDGLVQAYGEAVAHNLRQCVASNSSRTIGTSPGILRYLVAMTRELGGRTTPVTGAMDQGIHNYVVHMRPLRGAWLGQTSGTAAVTSDATAAPSETGKDAVLAFYQRERDAAWLGRFLGSLRCVGDVAEIHCVGAFNQEELALLSRFGCTAYGTSATDPEIAENIAHIYLGRALDRLEQAGVGHVLVMDTMRAIFLRDPFQAKTIGLSVFCEGPIQIGESPYNRDRVGFFVTPDETLLRQPVVSSKLMRGSLPAVRAFYRMLLAELIGRADLFPVTKVVQGLVNKLCHSGDLGFPIIVHPSGAEVFFDFLASNLAVATRHGVHIGGAVPAVIVGGHPESGLMLKVRTDLGLGEA